MAREGVALTLILLSWNEGLAPLNGCTIGGSPFLIPVHGTIFYCGVMKRGEGREGGEEVFPLGPHDAERR